MITKKIAEEIKKSLNGFDEKKMYLQMEKHYKILHLMDKEGKWVTPELEKHSNQLIPTNLTEEKSKEFVDTIAKIAEQNPYLTNFLEKAANKDFPKLAEKVKSEGATVFPDVVAYSFVLDRLTNAMYNEPKILEDCLSTFKRARSIPNEAKYRNLFHRVKLVSVEKPIDYLFLKPIQTETVAKNGGKYIVSLNILEATIDDYLSGLKDNARAGLTLFNNKSESKEYNPLTGARPTSLSKDGKSVKISMPLPKKWTDLYQTWNMAFCTKFNDYPYIIPKLFIPEVANYKKEPTKYIQKRALALYAVLNYTSFNFAEKTKNNEPMIYWDDRTLTKLWGESNAESALKYESELAKRKTAYLKDNDADKASSKILNGSTIKIDLKSEANLLRDKMLKKTTERNSKEIVMT